MRSVRRESLLPPTQEFLSALEALAPDVCITAAYGHRKQTKGP